MKVRSNLAITHVGPETLEEAVQDYINRNTDLYDLPGIVSVSIIRASVLLAFSCQCDCRLSSYLSLVVHH